MNIDADKLIEGLTMLQAKTDKALWAFSEAGALKMQTYAQNNAPWTDRSGSARQRLKGSVSKDSDTYILQIAHGVDYGVWLELAHEKRFAILPETIMKVGREEIVPAFVNLLDKL